MMELENSSPTAVSTASGKASASTVTAAKKKRNLPGTPDPDAEVIALSPKTLLATNRFVCEICSKGFQRDQNLQLHRRGHNLPWKLKQRANKEIRKKVYVCPETTCVHHDPRRALGDLTGIKKHFCRKHGEKKWKCERCSKTYAVLSDWKAHMKTCGTKEYRCDCGTLFSRKDSFVTHRAFCDALAQESARAQPVAIADSEGPQDVQPLVSSPSSPPPPPLTPSTGVLSPVVSIQSSEVPENPAGRGQKQPVAAGLTTTTASSSSTSSGSGANSSGSGSGVFASIFAAASSSSPAGQAQASQSPSSFSDMLCAMACPERQRPVEQPMSLSLSSSLYLSNNPSSLFSTTNHTPYGPTQQPALSATALLQKAAQIGATGSSSSFLRALGLEPSSMGNQNNTASTPATSIATAPLWNGHIQPNRESNSVASGLGLGLPTGGDSGLTDLIYANNPTVDFLGLGIGARGASSGGFSALLTSIGGGLDVSTGGAASFGRVNSGDQSERKPSYLP